METRTPGALSKEQVCALLKEKNIVFDYQEHPAIETIAAMEQLGLPHPEQIAKNLFLRDDKKRQYYLLSVKEEKHVDLKQLRQTLQSRPLSFASAQDLADLLGLAPGAVTPLGALNDTAHRVRVVLDGDFAGGRIGVHPCENTAMVWLDAQDLAALLAEAGTSVEFAQI